VDEHFANHFKAAKGVGAAFDGEANKWKAVEKFYNQLDLGRMMLAKVARRSDKLQSWVRLSTSLTLYTHHTLYTHCTLSTDTLNLRLLLPR
jgi:hypothetical protein